MSIEASTSWHVGMYLEFRSSSDARRIQNEMNWNGTLRYRLPCSQINAKPMYTYAKPFPSYVQIFRIVASFIWFFFFFDGIKEKRKQRKTYLHLCMTIYNYQCLFIRLNLKAFDSRAKRNKTTKKMNENREREGKCRMQENRLNSWKKKNSSHFVFCCCV